VLDYITEDEKVISCGVSVEKVRAMLTNMGFGVSRTAAAIEAPVGTLSGGWRMKLGKFLNLSFYLIHLLL
jgi:ATPase subunit of ABC transporter with duplicated ATPase domains